MSRFWFLLSTGFALFAMHFGAGNLVFPLALGNEAGQEAPTALFGLLLTAVAIPMLGFVSMMRFEGNTKAFFSAFGKWPGFLLMSAIVAVLCPFGAIPRCIAFTHTAIGHVLRSVTPSLELFCLGAVAVIFFMTKNEKNIVALLGKVLTPLLLICLSCVLLAGFFSEQPFSFLLE